MSENCQAGVRDEIRNMLGVQRVDFEAKYLGLPTLTGRLKRGAFQPFTRKISETHDGMEREGTARCRGRSLNQGYGAGPAQLCHERVQTSCNPL